MENKTFFTKFKNFWARVFKKADCVLFPKNIKCFGCGVDLPEKRNIEFCDNCKKKIEYIKEEKCCTLCGTSLKLKNICPHCKERKREFDIARSVCVYNDFMSSMISKFKYHNSPYMSQTFAYMLLDFFKTLDWEVDIVVPVPITKKRKKQRGFNQSLLIAQKFAKENKITLLDDVLIKTTETSHQADLNYAERQKNIVGTFKVQNKKKVAGKNVLIIDDVFTTGATTSACAEVLKKAKAKKVFVLCVASTNYFAQSDGKKQKAKKTTIKVADYVKNL